MADMASAVMVLIGFAAAAGVVAPIVATTWRVGIAPMPSTAPGARAMADLLAGALRHDANGSIADLGSGWGGLAVALARRFPDREVVGYELSWWPWAASVVLRRCMRLPNLRFVRADFRDVDLRAHAGLACYLHPAGMEVSTRPLSCDAMRPPSLARPSRCVDP